MNKSLEIPRVLVTADRSSSGKTTLVIGLLSCLKKRNYDVQGYKVGLDYIDPSYHKYITGNDSMNLDGFVMDEEDIIDIFSKTSKSKDISIIEGVRGLYEGIDIESEVGSTYQVAKLLKTPVILIMDVSSITKTAAAILRGIKKFKDANIKAVVLNGVGGKRHEKKLREAINTYTEIEILGSIPRSKEINIEMRHLGLIPAKEMYEEKKIQKKLKKIEQIVENNIDIQRIIEISNNSSKFKFSEKKTKKTKSLNKKIKIGLAYDKSFNFYYQSNLNLLNQFGADLVNFSPINDNKIPKDVSGLYLGGGYPELFAEELSENYEMRQEIHEKATSGMPIYAECGGLMYLLNKLITNDQEHSLVGYFNGNAYMGDQRVIGYVKGEMKQDNILGPQKSEFRGHEFHHSSIKDLKEKNFAYKLKRGKGIKNNKDGLFKKNTLASYCHLNFLSYRYIPKNFVKKCQNYQEKRIN